MMTCRRNTATSVLYYEIILHANGCISKEGFGFASAHFSKAIVTRRVCAAPDTAILISPLVSFWQF